jgi:hypothetical protein
MSKHRFSSINPNTGKTVFTIIEAKDYWAASKKAHSMLRGHTKIRDDSLVEAKKTTGRKVTGLASILKF